MRIQTLTIVITALAAVGGASAVSAQVSCAGLPAFQSCTAYASGTSVVYNNAKYTSIAPISATRDCPPSSPYNPGNDNWWSLQGTCTGATATRTATATATTGTPTPTRTATSTRTSTPTATRSATATPTTQAPWRLNTSYTVGANVAFNAGSYQASQAHTSDASHHPAAAPALWQNVGTPVPTCLPAITVINGPNNIGVGETLTVTASGNIGNGIWSVSVIDGATGLTQSPSNPIFTTTDQTTGVNHPGTSKSWVFRSARAGVAAFYVSVSGEGPIPGMCSGFASANAANLSPTVTIAGASSTSTVLMVRNHGAAGCNGQTTSPSRVLWSSVSGAQRYDIEFSSSISGPFTSYVVGIPGLRFTQHDITKMGYYRIGTTAAGGTGFSNPVFLTYAVPSCPVTPTATANPTRTAVP